MRDDDELLVWARAGACGERAVRPFSLDSSRKEEGKGDEREDEGGRSLPVKVGDIWMFGFGARW